MQNQNWESSGNLEIRIPGFHCYDLGLIPSRGTEMTQPYGTAKKKKETEF